MLKCSIREGIHCLRSWNLTSGRQLDFKGLIQGLTLEVQEFWVYIVFAISHKLILGNSKIWKKMRHFSLQLLASILHTCLWSTFIWILMKYLLIKREGEQVGSNLRDFVVWTHILKGHSTNCIAFWCSILIVFGCRTISWASLACQTLIQLRTKWGSNSMSSLEVPW